MIEEQVIDLKKRGFSYREIGENLDISHTQAWLICKEKGLDDQEGNPIFDDLSIYEDSSDKMLSLQYGVTEFFVTEKRKSLGIDSNYPVDLTQRREILCRLLFDNAQPGENFVDFIEDKINQMSQKELRNILKGFYINGTLSSLDDNNTDRVYRSTGRSKLEELLVGISREELIDENVIKSD